MCSSNKFNLLYPNIIAMSLTRLLPELAASLYKRRAEAECLAHFLLSLCLCSIVAVINYHKLGFQPTQISSLIDL